MRETSGDFSTHPSRVARIRARKLKGDETFQHAKRSSAQCCKPQAPCPDDTDSQTTCDKLTTGMVGTCPDAVATSVGAVTDTYVRPWSRAHVLGCPLAWGKGYRHAARAVTVDILLIPLWSEGFNHVLVGAPGGINLNICSI